MWTLCVWNLSSVSAASLGWFPAFIGIDSIRAKSISHSCVGFVVAIDPLMQPRTIFTFWRRRSRSRRVSSPRCARSQGLVHRPLNPPRQCLPPPLPTPQRTPRALASLRNLSLYVLSTFRHCMCVCVICGVESVPEVFSSFLLLLFVLSAEAEERGTEGAGGRPRARTWD